MGGLAGQLETSIKHVERTGTAGVELISFVDPPLW